MLPFGFALTTSRFMLSEATSLSLVLFAVAKNGLWGGVNVMARSVNLSNSYLQILAAAKGSALRSFPSALKRPVSKMSILGEPNLSAVTADL